MAYENILAVVYTKWKVFTHFDMYTLHIVSNTTHSIAALMYLCVALHGRLVGTPEEEKYICVVIGEAAKKFIKIFPPPNRIGQMWIMYALYAICLMFHLTYISVWQDEIGSVCVCVYISVYAPQKIIIIIEINERAKARIAKSHSKIIISMILLCRHTHARSFAHKCIHVHLYIDINSE